MKTCLLLFFLLAMAAVAMTAEEAPIVEEPPLLEGVKGIDPGACILLGCEPQPRLIRPKAWQISGASFGFRMRCRKAGLDWREVASRLEKLTTF